MQTEQNNIETKRGASKSGERKEVWSFTISSSAFSKVVPSSNHNKLFKELPSLLNLSEKLSEKSWNLKMENNFQERDLIFDKIYYDVQASFLAAKASLRGKYGFSHPINIKPKKARRGARNMKRHQDALLIEEIYSRINDPNSKIIPEEISCKFSVKNKKIEGENDSCENNKINHFKDCTQHKELRRDFMQKIPQDEDLCTKDHSKRVDEESPEAAVSWIFETIKASRTSFVDRDLNKIKRPSFYDKEAPWNTNSSSETIPAGDNFWMKPEREIRKQTGTRYSELVDELINL